MCCRRIHTSSGCLPPRSVSLFLPAQPGEKPNSRSLKVILGSLLCCAQSPSLVNICPVTETERMLLSWSWAALGSSHTLFTFPPTFPPEESSRLASLQSSQQKTRHSGMKGKCLADVKPVSNLSHVASDSVPNSKYSSKEKYRHVI